MYNGRRLLYVKKKSSTVQVHTLKMLHSMHEDSRIQYRGEYDRREIKQSAPRLSFRRSCKKHVKRGIMGLVNDVLLLLLRYSGR